MAYRILKVYILSVRKMISEEEKQKVLEHFLKGGTLTTNLSGRSRLFISPIGVLRRNESIIRTMLNKLLIERAER